LHQQEAMGWGEMRQQWFKAVQQRDLHEHLEFRATKGRMFFFEKKNQKTFNSLRTLPASRAPTVKSFLLLFFKKEAPCF
jgi:hypothetical protein